VRTSWLRTLLVSAVIGGVLAGAMMFAPSEASWLVMASVLMGMVILGGGTFFVGARILRMPELRWALGKQ